MSLRVAVECGVELWSVDVAVDLEDITIILKLFKKTGCRFSLV